MVDQARESNESQTYKEMLQQVEGIVNEISSNEMPMSNTSLDISNWKAGIYFLKVIGDGGMTCIKFIKE